jgi:hypothetical protein
LWCFCAFVRLLAVHSWFCDICDSTIAAAAILQVQLPLLLIMSEPTAAVPLCALNNSISLMHQPAAAAAAIADTSVAAAAAAAAGAAAAAADHVRTDSSSVMHQPAAAAAAIAESSSSSAGTAGPGNAASNHGQQNACRCDCDMLLCYM